MNDLKSNLRPNPNQIADSIVDLARMIESESEAEVIISEVITRSDKTPEDHIRTVNKLLSRYCNQNGWQQEKMRGQRGRLPVQPLGYVMSTKVIFRRAEVCLPRRPHAGQPRSDV